MGIETVVCRLCHTVHSESSAADTSRPWRCTRCGQHWDAARIAAVENYERWAKARTA